MSHLLSAWRRAVEFLGLKRSMAGMLGMVILVGMGEQIGERFLPRYIEALSGGAAGKVLTATSILAIGLLAGMDDLLSALYSFPGGYLSDRLGTKRALLVFNLLSMFGYVVILVIHTWWAVLVGAAFFISWSAISLPATMEIVAKVVPKNKRAMGVSMTALIRRVPKALGPVIGGTFIAFWGIDRGVRAAFVAAIVLALLGMVVQQRFIEDDRPRPGDPPRPKAEKNPFRLYREMSPELRNLLISDILIRFCERIPDCFVIIWCTVQILRPVTDFTFGWLSAVEQVTAVLCYIPVAHMADRFGKKPFVAVTFGFFTLFPLMLMFAQSLWALAPVFVLRGLKEFGEPSRKALIMDLAPENRKAAMFGLYYLIRDVFVSLAAFGGSLLWLIGPRVNLLAAFAFGVIGTTWFVLKGRDLSRAPGAA